MFLICQLHLSFGYIFLDFDVSVTMYYLLDLPEVSLLSSQLVLNKHESSGVVIYRDMCVCMIVSSVIISH